LALAALDEDLIELQATAARRARSARFPTVREQVVLRDGLPVGALVTAREGAVVHLIELGLLAEQRNLGIGTAVLGHLTANADRRALAIRTHVYRTNPRARVLYRRFGFQEVAADELMITLKRPAERY
jgi:ribosomal protein S18 acetylase RimI-like enzyme